MAAHHPTSETRRPVGSIAARGRPRGWAHAAWVLLVGGIALSLVSAGVWRGDLEADEHSDFSSTAGDVTASVVTALSRDMDLTAAAATLIGMNPAITNDEIGAWFTSVGADHRYPESFGFQYIKRVSAPELGEYAATAQADPIHSAALFDVAQILPSGSRPDYCFTRLQVLALSGAIDSETLPFPPGADWCMTPLATSLMTAAESGEFVVLSAAVLMQSLGTLWGQGEIDLDSLRRVGGPIVAMLSRSAFVLAPVYEDAVLPQTAVARRAALRGWVGGVFDVGAIVDRAVGNHTGLSLAVSRLEADGEPVALAGSVTDDHVSHFVERADVEADGMWRITVSGQSHPDGLSPDALAILGLVAGLVVTGLLFALVRVLTTSRNRALDLVDETTSELRHQALHDALTGLPNRALVLDRAEQMLARARREGTDVALLFIDLDNFKDINDTLGHAVGDQLLTAVAGRFHAALRETDTVGRLGGDEFVVVAEESSLLDGPELVAQRLLDVLREPFLLGEGDGAAYQVSASIGVAVGDRPGAPDLLRDADIALYEAKDAGKNCFVVFERRMQRTVQTRLELDMELRGALEADQFVLYYQPTFGIRDTATTGVEALLRWQHPTRGLVAPLEFLPLLESNGLIVPVGRWVLLEACRQGARWHAAGRRIDVSVNVSARQLDSGLLASDVATALAVTGFDAQHLVVEITETALMREGASTVDHLTALKAIGVRVAIDDFGTGYSSLSYLRQFPVDILKIDRSFIAGIASSSESAALVHTLVQLGKALGLETVAEGIESEEQLDRLQSEECDTGQGFFHSRPMPAADLDELLLTSPSLSGAGI